jgi:diguanylate cyclase (GGDEF)-like protein
MDLVLSEARLKLRSGRFTALTAFVATLAAVSAAALGAEDGWDVNRPVRFWLLAVLTLAGELLAIPVPRRAGLDRVTVSAPFALALLLSFGALPACAVYAAASVIADVHVRAAAIKVLFNASQYVLTLIGAVAALRLAGVSLPVHLDGSAVPGILLAALACFAVNHALAGTGAALLSHRPVWPYLRDDFGFQIWTGGCLLSLAPGIVASANATYVLLPVSFLPILAIYLGGRQAAMNAHRAFHDELTGLPNRAFLVEHLRAAAGHAHGGDSGVALMLVDLDDFKAVNDTLGHAFGDRVLRLVARRFSDAMGSGVLLARLGGDEFAAVVEGVCDEAEALGWGRRLLDALERAFVVDSLVLEIGASIGIAHQPLDRLTVDELFRHADIALYTAKGDRATTVLYSAEQDEYSLDRLALAAELRRGIANDELLVHFQPKLPLREGMTAGVEALVRWNHPRLGCLGPDRFISLAEQTGLIKLLTISVLENALRVCKQWSSAGLDAHFAVNLSARSLLDGELPAIVAGLLNRFGLPGSALVLEITESRIVADLARARTALDELRGTGVKIAIDDFGTGFSSLSQLQQLPIDEIKIDRSFVLGMQRDGNDAVMVRLIVELARNLGLSVTAEGVETAAVEQALRELGCDFAQGYHVGRPMPADECRRALGAAALAG